MQRWQGVKETDKASLRLMPRAREKTGGPEKWETGGRWQQGGVKSQSEREGWLRMGSHGSGLSLLQLEAAARGVQRKWLWGSWLGVGRSRSAIGLRAACSESWQLFSVSSRTHAVLCWRFERYEYISMPGAHTRSPTAAGVCIFYHFL